MGSPRLRIFVSSLALVAAHGCGASSDNTAAPTEDSSSSSTTGDTNGVTTSAIPFDRECFDCIANTCASPYTEVLLCLLGCNITDVVCVQGCGGPTDPNEALAFQEAFTCASTRCLDACTPDLPTIETGTDDPGETTSPTGADSSPIETGPEDADGGNTTSQLPTDGIVWLTLDGDSASAKLGDNALVGIDGAFYAYGDDCATINWSPETRCASGHLCSLTGDNWGAAIGFDFRATGPDAKIPNAKLSWSADENNAIGMVWNLRGMSPAHEVQTWFLVMDPQWDGVCTSDICEIPGPPNGGYAPFGLSDLLFDDVIADFWGFDYDPTIFDENNLVSVQFKLASLDGSGNFQVCIDDIGILIGE